VTCSSWRSVRVLFAGGLVMGTTLTASAQQPTSEQISAIRSSCRSDFMAQCAGVQPGTKEALECLKRNATSIAGL
jgi:Cysteine rich repeat